MKVKLNAESNLGYSADQVEGMSLGQLLDLVEQAVTEYGEDAMVVLFQTNNMYGANFGTLSQWQLFDTADEDGDDF